ncbi:30S ribosomal protein S20 [candidate division WOR-1 bacterium RIFCSPLOWO2_02_FULL_46_20]|uniref:Small ribosomal subunit protein bS20 n=2 Tax=Saganbacteria TaxID=1703751 RepID=A0A1F4RCK7_UNCSA|nr:MAG: 30S ribosomal protein S20 [candidate division WOR-1 bacterium RIFCSPHIGHO2_02_FULL_45_12]OGC05897.1 MAG: 30S ribosomal protein S20 [candidate division WOR-1 bacterium RIFCSPLOWO2_02_FULL_46_20]OGC09133.1 MAG: 30S ribosomal protein S20 [candidate division WOR-1 bacterium RIFCSPLOWO2_12_FULL_45_9]
MAQKSKSGRKRARTAKKRQARNVEAKQALKKAFKLADRAIAGKSAEVKELVMRAISLVDKTAQRGIIHKNKAARKKSRLVKRFNAA